MKKIAIVVALVVCAACTHKAEQVELTEWQFEYQGAWREATVPGFIHSDLMAHGLIADPYVGCNEDAVQWVSREVWHYRTTLRRSEMPKGDSLWLVFDGLMGVAIIDYDNAETQPLLADNAFVRHTIGLPKFEDSINIYVTFFPPQDSVKEKMYGITLPDRRAFTRVAPYQQGWDWGPKLLTCGIWQRAYVANRRTVDEEVEVKPNGVELRQEEDTIGRSFAFYKDGKPLFVKGANWIPAHSFPVDDEAQRARYRLLLGAAKEVGFNMIRVWGGGIYEHDYFYELCDSLGLMVWQDFNFSTMLYPDNERMLSSIRDEVRQQVARIGRHRCVVLWCGNNEVKNGWEDWGWQGVYHWSDEERARLEHALDTIFGYSSTSSNTDDHSILATAVRECDPLHRQYITTTPLYGWGHPECTTHGDSHYWGVWWGEMPFEAYAEKTGRFMSEYGFQSYPMMSSIRQFCSDEELDINSPTMRNHQKHGRGREIIDQAMRRYYGLDSKRLTLEDYAYVSQLLQAWGTGYGIVQHRLQEPRCMGTLYWQLNDCWPVASWSSIDYYGNWKALHYRVQALFADNVDLNRWEQYYKQYPKDRKYQKPEYNVTELHEGDSVLTVSLVASNDIYDIYIETVPHANGHFTTNFFDMNGGDSVTATFVPADPQAKLGQVSVEIHTLNDIYLKGKVKR